MLFTRLNVPDIFPSRNSSAPLAPSLHWVPSVRFPSLISNTRQLRLLVPVQRHFLLHAAVPRVRPWFAPSVAKRDDRRPGSLLKRLPSGVRYARGAHESSQVPVDPLPACRALRPRRTSGAHSRGPAPLVQPSALRTASAPRFNLSRLNHTACRPPVYASQSRSPPPHATLGSGWRLTFTGAGLAPAGSRKRFQISVTYRPPPTGFRLAHPKLLSQLNFSPPTGPDALGRMRKAG
jgi:hypothetical protein